MKLLNTALIKITLVLLAGILTGFYFDFPLYMLLPVLGGVFLIFLFTFFRAKKLFFQDSLFGTNAFLLFFFIGIATVKIHLPENQPRHYLKQISSEEISGSPPLLLVIITEHLKPDLYNEKYIAEVKKVDANYSHGKILLLFKKDSIVPAVDVDEYLLIASNLEPIPAPLNPHQFNYRRFMENRGIFFQTSPEIFHKPGNKANSLKGMAFNFRSRIIQELEAKDFSQDELAILQALLLGQRQDISNEIYNNYAAAGVIHILAVSGLHVGIILFLLHWLFSPLEKIKYGAVIKTLLLVVILWCFALLAGLSPSVVRAVTMFTFVAIGLQIKRRTSVYNTLCMSMLLLLLIHPQFIFEVGFQLSYLAVFSIVLIQPLLYRLYTPKNRVIKYLWGLLTVTLAAQAGVLPLSLFYFHQFPGLFFLSNLVILPFLGIILGLGILVVILSLLKLLPEPLVEVYSFFIEMLNGFVNWVAQQETFLFQDIPFSKAQLIVFYIFLLALIVLLKSITYRKVIIVLFSILLIQLVYYQEASKSNNNTLTVFHKSRYTLIGQKENGILRLHHNLKQEPDKEKLLKNYAVGEKINKINAEGLKNIYPLNSELLLVIDSTSIYEVPDFNPEYLLLINSPKLNLNRILEKIQPKKIIADGSNYKSYITRWKQTCEQKEIPFHYTGEKGAFIFEP